MPEGLALISPLFQPILQSTLDILSQYNEQEMLLILNFIRQCNEMILAQMNKMKGQNDA